MDKKSLSESDISDKYIRPAIVQAGWHTLDQIYAQYPLRAGRVVVRGKTAKRDQSTVLFADYVLCLKPNIPLAVVEAKRSRLSVQAGMQQAINFATLLDVAEQSRIVTRVAQLRRLCADLRQRLTASQSTQAHLAEALVQNV